MGRAIQKRKARSGASKVQRHQKSKKLALRNPIIAANWDKTKTLSQNYKALGLTSRLNKSTGGVEKRRRGSDASDDVEDSLAIEGSVKLRNTNVQLPEVRIERDPKTGAIVRVLEDTTTSRPKANPLDDPLNDVDIGSEDEKEMQEWLGLGRVPKSVQSANQKTEVVTALEAAAAQGVRKTPRKQSVREQYWIEQLVEKHGDDYEAMFRDRMLNIQQQSVGDIKRRVVKWQKTNTRH